MKVKFLKKTGEVKVDGQYNEKVNYEFLDQISSLNYYRLKLVDVDGKYSYSKTVYVQNSDEKRTVGQFYLNPAKGNNRSIEININEAGE